MDDRSGSVGYIDPNSEMKLVDEDGKEVGVGERGEICVRGPNICLGYWRNDKATTETFDEDGFLRTGDVAIRDDSGWYWIVDRKKELIKVKGFQVAPAELEAVLLENEHVADAAVVALQGDHEELPRAYISLKDASKGKVKEKDIQEWTATKVAKHKRLTGGVKVCHVRLICVGVCANSEQFIDEVPKSPSGKIQRKVIREWAAQDSKNFTKPKAKL
jgi:acyl-CoA synthetase (AMP-forming)/AMP-acid ligase II